MFTQSKRLVSRRMGALAKAFRQGGAKGLLRKLRQAVGYRIQPIRQRFVPERAVSLDPSVGVLTEPVEVTVIVTSQDRDHLLGSTLRSVQMQDGVSWECIVVDDGSSDRSLEIAQRFAAADTRFRVFTQDRCGVSVARNVGISVARGSMLCFIDDDDLMRTGALSERAALLREAPVDVAGAYCDWINVDHSVALAKQPRAGAQRLLPPITLASARSGTPFISSSPLLRTILLRQVGGFDESMRRGEDADLWYRILAAGYRFVPVNVLGIEYRRTPHSLVLSDPAGQLASLAAIGSGRPLVADPGAQDDRLALSLADIALRADRAMEILRYLALVAVSDVHEAVAAGRQLLPPCVVLELDPEVLADKLTTSAVNRLSLGDSASEVNRAAEAIGDLCEQLHQASASAAAAFAAENTMMNGSLPIELDSAREMTPKLQVVGADQVADGSILMIAEALYHVDELGPLADELRARGKTVEFMLAPKSVESARFALEAYADRLVEFDPSVGARAAAVVVLNDWGDGRALVQVANEHDVPTFAKVEGVQDFDDVDTGRVRSPYRTASYVLAQGANDVSALPEKHTIVVGSSRLERLRPADAASGSQTVLINLNFTFGVLTDERDQWVDSVIEALTLCGASALVSAHPSERSRPAGLIVSSKPFRHDIRRAGVLVTRFSTVPFEALAYGVPFVYHNPHDEQVPTFTQPDGAFRITRSGPELADAIQEALTGRTGLTDAERRFLAAQVDVDPVRSSEQRTADAILDLIDRV